MMMMMITMKVMMLMMMLVMTMTMLIMMMLFHPNTPTRAMSRWEPCVLPRYQSKRAAPHRRT